MLAACLGFALSTTMLWRSAVDAQTTPEPAQSGEATPAPSASPTVVPSPTATASPVRSAEPVTPGRAPVVLPSSTGEAWTPQRIATLRRDLDAMLTNSPALRGAHVGILAIDTGTGTPLYQLHADNAFQPASTLKLVVGSAALERLGTAFRFWTKGYVLVNARATVLLAGGDPFLSTGDFASFAAAVARTGVTKTSLSIDTARYDAQPYAPGWTWDDFSYDYAAPISAIALNENTVDIHVRPSVAGKPAQVSWSPTVVTVIARARTLPQGSESTLDVSHSGGRIVVHGGIAAGASPEVLGAAVGSATGYAYLVASALLVRDGVRVVRAAPSVRAALQAGALQARAQLVWTHESPPLADFLGPNFWIPSDNLVAELLLKELGFETQGPPGSTDGGIAFEKSWLRSIGVDPATMTLADGSGMSQYDRVTPRDLVAILQHDWNGPNRELVLASLPVGGARGTIEGIAGTAAAGRVFAKTGSMMHVRGLAGYLATEHHGAVTFAFNVDDWLGDYSALAALRAQILARIVED